jgi:hypothetical protein
MYGRNTQNSVVIVPRFASCQLSVVGCPAALVGAEGMDGHSAGSRTNMTTDNEQLTTKELRPGDTVRVRITSATAGSLQGEPLEMVNAIVQEA